MNSLCVICGEPYETYKVNGGIVLYRCKEDDLYMCPAASEPFDYGPNYELHYRLYARQQFSAKLHQARWKFVTTFGEPHTVLDFGCGIATFADFAPGDVKVYSYDPYFHKDMSFLDAKYIETVTFWDSLEHMRRLLLIPLLGADKLVMSIPILPEGMPIIEWRHFRPDEHVWYFSKNALCSLMQKFGYTLRTMNDFEIGLGRLDIWSFFFVRC